MISSKVPGTFFVPNKKIEYFNLQFHHISFRAWHLRDSKKKLRQLPEIMYHLLTLGSLPFPFSNGMHRFAPSSCPEFAFFMV